MGCVIPAGAAIGLNLYARILSAVDASCANGVGLEAYNSSHWGNYAISMPEQAGSGTYILTVPGYLPAGRYFALPYIQFGGSPVIGVDGTSIDIIFFDWDGGNVLGFSSALNVGKINGSAPAAANLALSTIQFVIGAAAAGTLNGSQMTTNLVATVANIYAGRILYFTSGVNAGLAVLITAYAVTGGKLTFVAYNNQPAPSAPSAGDTFVIN